MTSSEKLPKNSGFQSHHACLYELSVKLPGSKTFTWLDDKGGEVASLTVAEVRGEVELEGKEALQMIGYTTSDEPFSVEPHLLSAV
jgi:hypothetical protein